MRTLEKQAKHESLIKQVEQEAPGKFSSVSPSELLHLLGG